VVIERVVKKSTAAIVLTRTNYSEWALVMRVNLQVVGLWDIISQGIGDYREDRNSLAVMLWAVPQEMQPG
jgi:hypothetical protein